MTELVQRNESGQAITNSLLVAEKFEKEHKNVIQSIQNLVAENSAAKLYFVESEYENRGKMYPMYIMNRDGFSLLVMSFTGEKALKFKMDFLNAFNQMEALLSSDEYILMRSQEILQNKVKQLESSVYEKEGHIAVLKQEITKSAPKVQYHDEVMSSAGLLTTTEIAKNLGWSAIKLNTILKSLGVQFKQSGHWMLYAKYADKGYAKLVPYPYPKSDGTIGTAYELKWFEAGKKFIHDLLKSKGLMPTLNCNG